jgi:lipopolysaccharide transport system ATP-binding protein
MPDTIIEAEGLSKHYFISHQGAVKKSAQGHHLSEMLQRAAMAPLRFLSGKSNGAHQTEREEFWALKDVSFKIKAGEVVGIIGRNGAGKSTLLKVLSRITKPTSGEVRIHGRIASLLEVGTGFHPELTGRENIFLNGAILGMSRLEIKAKFDEIVDFSGVERFLDTAVKHYSSGMYVRLAFAVAAHLEPEILIVDEVLAVGDADFQKKCLGKMSEVSQNGRTVLLVSHNMNAIERLCGRVLCMEKGRLVGAYDDARTGIMVYHKSGEQSTSTKAWKNNGSECQNDFFIPETFEMASDCPNTVNSEPFSNQYDIIATVTGEIRQADPALSIGLAVYEEGGNLLFWSFTTDHSEEEWPKLRPGKVQFQARIPKRWLNEGTYRVELMSSLHYRKWPIVPGVNAPVVTFDIIGGLSDSPYWDCKRLGLLAPVLEWKSS